MSMQLKFICPKCGKETWIQEQIKGVTVYNEIDIYRDGDYDVTFCDDDEFDDCNEGAQRFVRYLCGTCGEDIIPEITGVLDARRKLYEYLLEQDYNKEVKKDE